MTSFLINSPFALLLFTWIIVGYFRRIQSLSHRIYDYTNSTLYVICSASYDYCMTIAATTQIQFNQLSKSDTRINRYTTTAVEFSSFALFHRSATSYLQHKFFALLLVIIPYLIPYPVLLEPWVGTKFLQTPTKPQAYRINSLYPFGVCWVVSISKNGHNKGITASFECSHYFLGSSLFEGYFTI